MLAKLRNLLDRIVTWNLWRGVKKKIRPFNKVKKVVQLRDLPCYMRLILDSLRTGEYAGIILVSDSKSAYNYIKRTVGNINTVFFRVPYRFSMNMLFTKVKENANVMHVDFSVTGYSNDCPFYVLVVPKDGRMSKTRRDCHKKVSNKRNIKHKHSQEI